MMHPQDLTATTTETSPFTHASLSSASLRPLADTSLEGLRNFIRPRLPVFEECIREAGVGISRVELTGSVESGHYRGPKCGAYSWNPNNPVPSSEQIVEFDIKIFLKNEEAIGSPETLVRLKEALSADNEIYLGSDMTQDQFLSKFLSTGPALLLYRYDRSPEGPAIEYEFAIIREPGINASRYIPMMFSPEEVAWQGNLRLCAQEIGLPYADYCATKGFPYEQLNWRLTTALASAQAGVSMPSDFPVIIEPVPPILKDIVDAISSGKAPPDPFCKPPDVWRYLQSKNLDVGRLLAHAPQLAEVPQPPAWVQHALNLDNQLFAH